MTGKPTDIVFVVERDDDLRARLSGYLSASGFTVRGFSSAESFLASLPISGPACVVVDQHLPGLSGPDLQQQLLDNPVLAMVFITDSGDVSTVVQAMRDGAVDFLMKPIEADQLIAAVTRGLQKGKGAETKRQTRDTFLSRVEMLTAGSGKWPCAWSPVDRTSRLPPSSGRRRRLRKYIAVTSWRSCRWVLSPN